MHVPRHLAPRVAPMPRGGTENEGTAAEAPIWAPKSAAENTDVRICAVRPRPSVRRPSVPEREGERFRAVAVVH